MPDKFRTEAYCHEDERIVPITKVRTSVRLSGVIEAHQAMVNLACGHNTTIVTTARNLREMETANA